MAFHDIEVEQDVAPNLVPMVDIMFLLLLFFMLNADMSQRELEEIVPPVAKAAQEDKPNAGDTFRITVNIHHLSEAQGSTCAIHKIGQVCRDDGHWRIAVSGRSYEFNAEGQKRLVQHLTELARKGKTNPNDPNSISETKMLVRADRLAPYGYIQKAMEAAAFAKLYKIEVGAGIPKEVLNERAAAQPK